ncbi:MULTISPECIES: GNAT family N-acetyltransferase [unclassified Pseudoalteromonas]|uniref:GNAT family N-acetyltransferase n=1 Tax=unclassified Pseudoalteromonas TaxID=194690 RepID=UPI000B3C678E|nr:MULTISPECIES: GNAT family N-acetyltransferase [unclassified Pseudoalteromonas]MDN3376830.1 GNAT family N-acetyltransferase [Pseudoalteromonas sp. APC 3893]MDN3387460.1 GNAT family N-acetyltransferase [Pseudoalteromonas sp. APC 4017]OUS71991.1 hypothetical protein B5G52_09030 [Pseudoalteromonas sp. A601]
MRHYPLYKIDDVRLHRLGAGVIKTYNLTDITNLDIEKAINKECQDLLALNDDCTSDDFIELRQRRNISDNVPDDDLFAQVIEDNDGNLFIASVCRNDDDETMFEIFSEHSLTASVLKELASYIRKVFCWCTPVHICVWPAPDSPQAQQLLLLPGARAVDSLLGSQTPLLDVSDALKADISLQPFELEKDRPWYEQEYNQFLTENPAMANIVPISDKEELSESIEAGLCSMAFYQGQPLGMVMGEASEELGFDGLLVSDIFIAKQFRGQGLASPMQRLYYELHCEDFNFFFGYIDATNKPSYKNALKQGRKLLRQELYLPAQQFL